MKLKTFLNSQTTPLNEAHSDSSMYDMNLTRLMDASIVKIDDDYYDELADYLTEIDTDLNKLNIDDLVVNGIQFLKKEEVKDEDDYMILKKTDKGYYVFN